MPNERDMPRSCDIFCNVVDNYGDIGVCWRLARQLAHEHGLAVRLWADDLGSLAKLCPEADAALDIQRCRGVEVRRWAEPFPPLPLAGEGLGERGVADLVIEAFACKLPQGYVEAMAAQEIKPVWINLEYLSAEDWVEGCHGLPSPQPGGLPLTRYFFFPGFTKQTGGLLLERDLFVRRDAFQSDTARQQAFWQSHGMDMPGVETLTISLFGYENDALAGLFDAWASGTQAVLCLVPEGRILPQVEQYFDGVGRDSSRHASVGMNPGLRSYSCGKLEVRVLPFVEQDRYDELLWACDVNFVRGEDSCVRAQWAARPFVWHIYPQQDGVHRQKLRAFMARYCAGLSPEAARALHGLWEAWNGGCDTLLMEPLAIRLGEPTTLVKSLVMAEPADCGSSREATAYAEDDLLVPSKGGGCEASLPIGRAWNDFREHQSMLRQRARGWAQDLAANNLALNLLDFSEKIGRMRAFKIEGQQT